MRVSTGGFMEKLDKDIIALLTEDSRITCKRLAAALNITEKQAEERVRSLEEGE